MTVAGEPLISIIIAAYRYERYVAHCIESCLGQVDAPSFETILVDDGSPDATAAIARRYEPRLRVVSIPNGGIERASNHGVSLARGKFWLRVDADDALAPSCLASFAPYLNDDSWAFLYGNYRIIDAQNHVTSTETLPEFDPAEIRERGDFLAGGTLFRASAVASFGPYSEEVRNCGLENYELLLHLLAAGARGKHLPNITYDYRLHTGNMSVVRREQIIGYGRKLATRFGLPAYRTNRYHPYKLVL